ncbi:hypothetical protein BAE44_0009343, partial [Dichanthelium oligosanthes]
LGRSAHEQGSTSRPQRRRARRRIEWRCFASELRSHLLSAIRTPSPLPAASSLHRFLLLSTTTASPSPFVVEDFLVTSCGLPPALARASRRIANLKSPAIPEAALALFVDSGLAKADLAAAIARDLRLICSKVEKSLKPRLALLRDIGLSLPHHQPHPPPPRPPLKQISSLIAIHPDVFLSPRKISSNSTSVSWAPTTFLLGRDLERVVKPNMALLRQCGGCFQELTRPHPTVHMQILRYSDFLKKALGCSDTELGIAVRKLPTILSVSEVRLNRVVEFLEMEVGLKVEYIVHRPALFTYSVKMQLMPRH